jgi:AraC-like DNA-binding protein
MTTLLDTRVVPPSERPDYWSDGIAEHFFPMRTQPSSGRPFEARLTGGEIGPLAVRTIGAAPHHVVRTPRMIAEADPEAILLYLLRHGSARIEQDGRSCELRPGDLAIQDTSRPSAIDTHTGFDLVVVSIPKWFIGAGARGITDRSAMRLSRGEGPFVQLASPFVGMLADTAGRGGLDGRAGDAAAEMLLTALRTLADDGRESPRTRGDALLARLQRYALENLHDPDLGPERLAETHFISTRYVHKLFTPVGLGVSAWIREQRLDAALEELRESSEDPIALVAVRWGYRDPASFSRAFREQHGFSPREARGTR